MSKSENAWSDDVAREIRRMRVISRIQAIISEQRRGRDSQHAINEMVLELFRAKQHQSWVNHQIFPCDDRG
jgi:hypothetical protein